MATLAQPFPGLSDQGATSSSGDLGCISGRPLPLNFVRGRTSGGRLKFSKNGRIMSIVRGFKVPVRFAPRQALRHLHPVTLWAVHTQPRTYAGTYDAASKL
jgi:hypothetical protein